MASIARTLGRLVALAVLSALALQLYFLARVALMTVVDPQSTTFQRSEAWRLLTEQRAAGGWSQHWVPYERISPNLKRAVIAAEDAGFAEHSGVEWDALEKAWERNQKAEARVEKINDQIERRLQKAPGGAGTKAYGGAGPATVARALHRAVGDGESSWNAAPPRGPVRWLDRLQA